MNDSINRQEVINIVTFECGKWTGLSKEINKQIQNLPSADPEFIRCENCKYCEHEVHPAVFGMPVPGDFICNVWGGGCITKPDGFCFLAERRTDE